MNLEQIIMDAKKLRDSITFSLVLRPAILIPSRFHMTDCDLTVKEGEDGKPYLEVRMYKTPGKKDCILKHVTAEDTVSLGLRPAVVDDIVCKEQEDGSFVGTWRLEDLFK